MKRYLRYLALISALALVLAACGGGGEEGDTTTTAGEGTTTTAGEYDHDGGRGDNHIRCW